MKLNHNKNINPQIAKALHALKTLDIRISLSIITDIQVTELPVTYTTNRMFGSYSYATSSSGLFYYKILVKDFEGFILIEDKLGEIRLVRNSLTQRHLEY